MSLVFKNSANTTSQKPLVNINGDDFSVNDLTAIAQEAGRIRTTATFEETLTPYVPPTTTKAASNASNTAAGLQTPA